MRVGLGRVDADITAGIPQVARIRGSVVQGVIAPLPQALTFQTAVTWNVPDGDDATLSATTNAAHTVAAPTLAVVGQLLILTIRNVAGVAMATTGFNAAFHLQAAWTAPATGFHRAIAFRVDAVAAGVVTAASELYRNTADVAN